MTSDEILAKLFALRKDYEDDKEDPTYQSLHHACLFISYRIADFKAYLQDAARHESSPDGEDKD